MAIIVRHRTLSQKTQSAIAGIISKNEWNDTHVIDAVNEGDIVFSSTTGHTHDGSNSAIAVKTNTVNDSYLGSTNYRYASKYPQANEIPILDGDGYMNIRRVGSTQYSKINFTDGTTIKSSLMHDFTAGSICLTNITGTQHFYLYSTGEISAIPKSAQPFTIVADNTHLKNIVATNDSEVRLNFKDSVGTVQGYLGYKFHSTDSSNILSLKNTRASAGGNVNLDGAGNIILNAKGISGKSYYTHNSVAPTANDEIATLTNVNNVSLITAIDNATPYNFSGTSTNGIASTPVNNVVIPYKGIVWDLQITTGLGYNGATIHIWINYYIAGAWRTIPCHIYYNNGTGDVTSVGLSDVIVGYNGAWPVTYLFCQQPLISNGSNIRVGVSIAYPGNTAWQWSYKLISY